MSVVWPALGTRMAKEQNRTVKRTFKPHVQSNGSIHSADADMTRWFCRDGLGGVNLAPNNVSLRETRCR